MYSEEICKEEDNQVTLLEQEQKLGFHASTQNSGVIHAGFYYSGNK